MKRKSIVLSAIMLVMAFVFGACSSNGSAPVEETSTEDNNEWEFERAIEIVMPFGVGGGSDTTWRAIAPLLEKELGVPIKINNVSGASGVKGAEYMYAQPADGYTFMAVTPSHCIAAARGTVNYDLINEVVPIAKVVHDANIVLAGADTSYDTLDELVEFVKGNPGVAKIGLLSIDGIDAASVNQLFDELDLEIPLVPFDSGAEANAAVLGGHVDMIIAGPGEVGEYIKNGDFKPIVVLSENRASSLPETPCTGELGINAILGPWRGIVAKKGTPKEAIDEMEKAIEKISASAEFEEWREQMSLNDRPSYANAEEFTKIWEEYYIIMDKIINN